MSVQLTDEEALRRAAAYCSAAEHCRAEVADKLQRQGIAYESIARILNRLEAENFINEDRYCRAFINDKFRFAKWGKNKIAQALSMKKIPLDVAWMHIHNTIDKKEYLDTLRNLLATKQKSIKAQNEYELKGKLIRFATSRGFEYEDIQCCLADC